MSVVEVTDDDRLCCETIAKSISDIIRFSLNEEFRKNSCELFGVFSTKDVENEINKKLISILDQKCTNLNNRSKGKNKENVQEQNDISNGQITDESSSTSTDCNSQTAPQNPLQRNWLQISSQQYRDVIKRRKLQFYSQPHTGEPYQDFEFARTSSHFSNSQPISEDPSGSQLSSLEDRVSFCKKRFKQSFRDNARKYLRKSLKYHKHLRF